MKKCAPFLSVIVPIYNVEVYLRKCLDSILAQTFTDFEVICVDDGSTDRSLTILKAYASKDGRISVISKENGGLVSARKAGAEYASGDYIICLDPDDWIEDTYFEKLIAAQKATHANIVIADLYYVTDANISVHRNACATGPYHSRDLCPIMLYKPPFFGFGVLPSLATKLIDRKTFCKCIQEIDERIVWGEDAALSCYCLMQDVNVFVSDICGYHYIQRRGSITKKHLNNEYDRCSRLIDFLESLDIRYHAGLHPQIEQYYKFAMLLRCPEKLDTKQLLEPYGGIPDGSRIVLYGAGGAGNALYSYLSSCGRVEIVLWADRNFGSCQRNGLPVASPMRIGEISGQYDHVIIAVTAEGVAGSIRRDLLSLGVPDEKIRWLSPDFINN